jgi:hypothetical protein
MKVPLHRVAHARAGDKGNRLNVSLICYAPKHYETVRAQITAEHVAGLFASRRPAKVVRYELPRLHAFNFVLDDVLDGGVNASLGLDGHGKTLSFLLLGTTIDIEPALLERLAKGENA